MNRFGRIFTLQIYGESHGPEVGILMDGVPPGTSLSESDFIKDIGRRKPGRKGTTPRVEADMPIISSGVLNGRTTGTPLHLSFKNTNVKSEDYKGLRDHPRPGHADYVAEVKYKGYQDPRGGGHFSGRLTLCLVAAGVVAKKILGSSVSLNAQLVEAGGSKSIDEAIDMALESGDSVGGLVSCKVNGINAGLGEPFFDSLESLLAHALFSIPAVKGVEFGSGFKAASMKGSEHNDLIENEKGKTTTNHAGGINGGITNGNQLTMRVAFKPPSSIPKAQATYDFKSGAKKNLKIKGRHDACIALRAPVVVEAVVACVLADLLLLRKTQNL